MLQKKTFLALLLTAMSFLPVKAEPVVVPPNTPFKADVTVVVVPLEEYKEFMGYVGQLLDSKTGKCTDWKSEAKTQQEPSLAVRKEN